MSTSFTFMELQMLTHIQEHFWIIVDKEENINNLYFLLFSGEYFNIMSLNKLFLFFSSLEHHLGIAFHATLVVWHSIEKKKLFPHLWDTLSHTLSFSLSNTHTHTHTLSYSHIQKHTLHNTYTHIYKLTFHLTLTYKNTLTQKQEHIHT